MNAPTPPARRRLDPKRRRAFAAVALAGSTLVALVGAELVARLFFPVLDPNFNVWPPGYYEPAEGYGYRLSRDFPPTEMTYIDGAAKNLCYTNSLGMRDVEPPPPRPGSLRILCLGDSQTEGYGVTSPEQPWPRALERELGGAPGDFVAMNGGVGGYNTFQEVEHAKHLQPEAKADVWLMAYFGGMWGRNAYGLAGQFRMKWGALYDELFFEQLGAGRTALGRRAMDVSVLWRRFCLHSSRLDPSAPRDPEAYGLDFERATRDALAAFRDAAREAGVAPVVVYLPHVDSLDHVRAGGSPDDVAPRVAAVCDDLGLPFFDPTPGVLAELAREGPDAKARDIWTISPIDAHYNPRANAAYAKAVAAAIRDTLDEVRRKTSLADKFDTLRR